MTVRISKSFTRAFNLLSSFEALREGNVACDFTIKVDGKEFRVHRAVLIASSKYYRAMLTTGRSMKEGTEGHVEMKGLPASAMGLCVDFMYTGKIEIAPGTVGSIIHVSTLIELDEVTQICAEFLLANVSVEYCLKVRNLALRYNLPKVVEVCDNFVITNYEAVTETLDHQKLCKEDAMRFVSNMDDCNQVSWGATSRWINFDLKKRKCHLMEFMNIFKAFNSRVLLDTMAEDPLVQENSICFEYIGRMVLQNASINKPILETRNCFVVKLWTTKYADEPNAAELEKFVDELMLKNMEDLYKMDKFDRLSYNVLYALMSSSEEVHQYIDITKWHAIIKWIHSDLKYRTRYFQKLFKSINLDTFTADFIQNTVRSELLVQASSECKDMIIDTLYARVKKLEQEVEQYENYSDDHEDDNES